ncbi:hypothetical protein [Prevotella sp.]|uniref:hypothetical protein n=1 Tax=Prevotella sp. TaxID=59823 RepID=UPI002F94BA1E
MKIKNILYAMGAMLLPMSFIACDNNDDPQPVEPEAKIEYPALTLKGDTVRVKVGAENKATLDITSGGGEYRAFVLDTTVAKVSQEGDKLMVEGFKNGMTNLVVSDKNSRYRRVCVSVYTTDVMTISKESFEMLTPLGQEGRERLEVKGNGGYTVESDNDRVSGEVNEETSQLVITARSRIKDFTATLTVKDITGLQAQVKVTVKSSKEAFTAENLEAIKNIKERTYAFDASNYGRDYYDYLNEDLGVGKVRYGFDYYNWYYLKINFSGGRSVGKKTDGILDFNYNNDNYSNQPVTVEIIKNDGNMIWGIFSWLDEANEALHRGYWVDTVQPSY